YLDKNTYKDIPSGSNARVSGSNTGKTPMVIEEVDGTDSSVASEDSDDSDFDVGEEDRIKDLEVDMAIESTQMGMLNGPGDSGLGDSGPVCDKPKLDSGSNKKTKKEGKVEDNNKCPWLLSCSKSKNAETWWVKQFDDNHTCLQSRTVGKCTASFLSKEVKETIKPNPKVPIPALKDQLQRKYELCMSDMKVFRAKQMAKERVIGDWVKQYAQLRQYALELKEQNPDTTIKIDVERCFDVERQILTSVGVDPNNGIYPLAYAVVESEKKDSWLWFLDCLGDDLELCATATTVQRFGKNMKEIKKFNKEMYEWLKDIPPHHWARSQFSGRPHCDVLLNNMCKVLNRKLLNGKDKPIITCLEFIREYLMKRIVIVQGVIGKSTRPLTPNATKVFNVIKREAAQYKVVWNGGDLYETTRLHGYKCVTPKKRRKSAAEIYDGLVKKGRLSRTGKTVTCLKCGQQGHNKRSCKGQRQKGSASGSQAPPQAPSQTTTQASAQAPQSSIQPSQASAQAS
ncbi:mutator type transposase, partial [Tanacetum coccineum]